LKTYLILFIFFIVGSANAVSASESQAGNSEKSSSTIETITSHHSKSDHTSNPFIDFTQIETEEEEEKLKNAIKRNSNKEFVFISPFSSYLTFKEAIGAIDLKFLLVNSTSFITSSTPIYLRISVFRI
tara:strand:+ start:936 stop:1319 length:384 start_codon:yes stop_codon:yes gene_type:complete